MNAVRSLTGGRAFGAHAVALTREQRVVLVKLRYAPGWRLPGGGRKEGEDPRAAVLRELKEEIGLVSHGEVQLASAPGGAPGARPDTSSLLIVRDVQYRPRWSLEVEAVTEAELHDLPRHTSRRTLRWLAAVRPLI